MKKWNKIVRMFAVWCCIALLLPLCSGCKKAEAAQLPAEKRIQIDGELGKLAAALWQPALKKGETCPMVILMHGFTSDKEDALIKNIAEKLQAENIGYIRFDFNGHGESEGEFQYMTVPNEIGDARKVYEYVRSLEGVGEIALLGHSQGGVVAAMAAGELGADKVARLVLMAPAAVLKEDALGGNTMGVKYDPVNIPEYVPLFNHRLGRDYIKTAQTLPIYETAARYAGKVCVIHGKADEIVPYTYGERFREGYDDCEWHLMEGEDHAFSRDRDGAAEIGASFLKAMKITGE